MSEQEWANIFREKKVLWRLLEGAEGAHALLTSGKHSDGYMNCAKVVEDPNFVAAVASALIEKMKPYLSSATPDYVVGPAYGAITIAHEVARQMETKFGFTEVLQTAEGKMQELKRFDIKAGERVLVVEDVKTTGGSAQKTIDVLEAAGVEVLPVVGFIMNWSESMLGDRQVISLLEGEMNIWEPDQCPLCQESVAVRPKSNWDELAR